VVPDVSRKPYRPHPDTVRSIEYAWPRRHDPATRIALRVMFNVLRKEGYGRRKRPWPSEP
jgi:hypothetical protein